MDNASRIRKLSRSFYLLFSFLSAAIPLYYACYWFFLNDLPDRLITVNMAPTPLVPNHLAAIQRLIGFLASLFPMSVLIYGMLNVRKLFLFYSRGIIFSFEHVVLFKKTAKAFLIWVFLSILYESAKSVLFTVGNPPGKRLLQVGFGSEQATMLLAAGILFVIAWIMDEGRILREENELTV